MDKRIKEVSALKTVPLFDMIVDLETPLNFGAGPLGHRIFYRITGGSFSGPDIQGTVLPGGGDWATINAKGAMTLDVRLSLKTEDNALIMSSYKGRMVTPPELAEAISDPTRQHEIDPENYYFRSSPMFETGAKNYAWMNDIICVGKGYLVQGGIAYRVFKVL